MIMKTISKEFMRKIIREQGILDTENYRYVAIDDTSAKRLPIRYIGTTAAIGAEWEKLTVRA